MKSETNATDASEQPFVHAPGEWFIDRNHSGKIIGVASPSRKHDLDFVCGFSSPTNEADARLIAAAPDMLEALKGLVAWSKRSNGTSRDVVDRAKEVIEKATGQPWQEVV